jgi:hypothetical protein
MGGRQVALPEPEYSELLAHLGDPAEEARQMQQFSKDARKLSAQHQELTKQYPDEYVAMYRGKIAAHGPDLPAVLEELDRKGVPRGRTAVRFLATANLTFIL